MGKYIQQKFFRVAKLRFLDLLTSSNGRNCPVPPKTPQEGPSGLKTVPTSIIHDSMWCWPTLGPFKYPQRPKKALFGAHEVLGGPWRSSEGPRWPDLVPTATSWSNWVGHTYIMCSGPLRDLFDTPGTPKRAQFWPKRPFWEPPYSSESPIWGPIFVLLEYRQVGCSERRNGMPCAYSTDTADVEPSSWRK